MGAPWRGLRFMVIAHFTPFRFARNGGRFQVNRRPGSATFSRFWVGREYPLDHLEDLTRAWCSPHSSICRIRSLWAPCSNHYGPLGSRVGPPGGRRGSVGSSSQITSTNPLGSIGKRAGKILFRSPWGWPSSRLDDGLRDRGVGSIFIVGS